MKEGKESRPRVLRDKSGFPLLPPAPWYVFPIIVFSVFTTTSLWFAPNSTIPYFIYLNHNSTWDLKASTVATSLSSAVQLGFITGTLILFASGIPDKFSPNTIFHISGLIGSILNTLCLVKYDYLLWISLRFLIGICLAGIYPIGMEIASQRYRHTRLGLRLGYLVGALTLGTAFPWFLAVVFNTGFSNANHNEILAEHSLQVVRSVLVAVSFLSLTGSMMILLVRPPRRNGDLPLITREKNTKIEVTKTNNLNLSKPNSNVNDVNLNSNAATTDDLNANIKNSNASVKETNGNNETTGTPNIVELHDNNNDEFGLMEEAHAIQDEFRIIQKQTVAKLSEFNKDFQEVLKRMNSINIHPPGCLAERTLFQKKSFLAALLGYFGHNWEVYTFWAYIPILIQRYYENQDDDVAALTTETYNRKDDLLTFFTIAAGSVGCIAFGHFSDYLDSEIAAISALSISGLCCLLSPWSLHFPEWLFMLYLIIWGITVSADSAQFSSLVSERSPRKYLGTALTMSTCIGYSLTIVSMQIVQALEDPLADYVLLILVPGPIIGVAASIRNRCSAGNEEPEMWSCSCFEALRPAINWLKAKLHM